MDKQNLIPDQEKGKQVDLMEKKDFPDRSAAEKGFLTSAEKLLQPQGWHELCGKASAAFEVISPDLEMVDRSVKEGDFLRIDIPGPGSSAGKGYDWVRVTMIQSEKEERGRKLGIRLDPSRNPENKKDTTAHFFKEGSSSTLEIILNEKTVEAHYHGRNEVVNNETGKLADDVRNTIVAAGAKAGLSEAQWGELLKGLIGPL